MAKKILVVEDDEEYRALAEGILSGAGYEVLAAANGAEGLELFFGARPDLVLLDVMLPDMLGFDFCRKVRASKDGGRTPVLLCTVRSAVPSLARGVNSGADDYVIKPFVPEDLLERIRAVLRGRKP